MAHFADGIKKLQASSVSPIHLCFPFYRHLRTLLTSRVHRIAVMTSISRTDCMAGVLAARALRMINSKLIVHPLHIAASLLHFVSVHLAVYTKTSKNAEERSRKGVTPKRWRWLTSQVMGNRKRGDETVCGSGLGRLVGNPRIVLGNGC
jgi:hypothetical protein